MSVTASGFAYRCRFCEAPLTTTFVDLGLAPPSQNHIAPADLDKPELFFPLHVFVCDRCLLVQLPLHVSPEAIFTEYAYFSSYSDSWVRHAREYVAAVTPRFGLGSSSKVVEIASNDGYLLQHFVERSIPCLGVEPAANVAEAARARGVPTRVEFFGRRAAERIRADFGPADLIVANNVLAHVPDLNDFVAGVHALLASDGVATFEFPHVERLVTLNQFDTIYHEHFSYFSFAVARRVLAQHGLRVFDVEQLATHGGSLRVYAAREAAPGRPVLDSVERLAEAEIAGGFDRLPRYQGFGERVAATKRALLCCLSDARSQGLRIAGYGAPGKGNTLLNYCGIRTDFLEFTVDRNPYKQGKYTPGTRIPIRDPAAIREARPDLVLILPWNLEAEICDALAYIRSWGGRFIVPIPQVRVF